MIAQVWVDGPLICGVDGSLELAAVDDDWAAAEVGSSTSDIVPSTRRCHVNKHAARWPSNVNRSNTLILDLNKNNSKLLLRSRYWSMRLLRSVCLSVP